MIKLLKRFWRWLFGKKPGQVAVVPVMSAKELKAETIKKIVKAPVRQAAPSMPPRIVKNNRKRTKGRKFHYDQGRKIYTI